MKKITLIAAIMISTLNFAMAQIDQNKINEITTYFEGIFPIEQINSAIASNPTNLYNTYTIFKSSFNTITNRTGITETQMIEIIKNKFDWRQLNAKQVSFLYSQQPSKLAVDLVNNFSLSNVLKPVTSIEQYFWEVKSYDGFKLIVEQRTPLLNGQIVGMEFYWVNQFLYSGTNLRYSPNYLQNFMFSIEKKVRKWMRDNSLTIVMQPDKTNPVTIQMQPIIQAVNEPMMQGLEEAVAKFGVSITVDRTMKNKLEILQQAVWNGDEKATLQNINAIRFLLGTAKYNEWAAKYNGQ